MSSRGDQTTRVQSDLDFDRPEPGRGLSGARLAMQFTRWIPVAALLALLAQVGIRGLRPALAEGEALERKEAELEEQYSAALAEKEQLELRLRAQGDPIYIERMRRLRMKQELEQDEAAGRR